MTDPQDTPQEVPGDASQEAPSQYSLPALPSLVMPEIKITDDNAIVVAAARLRVIRDQYSQCIQLSGDNSAELTVQMREQFKRDIEGVVALIDRAWAAQHPAQA